MGQGSVIRFMQTVGVEISDICRGTTIQYDARLYLPHNDSKQDGQMLITGIHSCRRHCCVVSGRGISNVLITRPEKLYGV